MNGPWPFMAERCQFHLAQNAIHHAPTTAIRKRIGSQLREIWNAKNLAAAEAELKSLLEAYRKNAPELAAWLETAIPEGLAVFTLPEHHRKRMRTSNPIERAVQQELKRRTSRSASSPTMPHCSTSSPPCSSKSTKHGRLQPNPATPGAPRMLDRVTNEFPDIG